MPSNNPNVAKNLKPFPKGKSGNPKGRPPGIKNWSTVVQDILANPGMIDKIYTKPPGWLDELPTKNGAYAIAGVMLARASSGDVRAADWLRKTGYGDKIDFTSGGDTIARPIVIMDFTPTPPPKRKRKVVNAKPKAKAKARPKPKTR